MANAYKEKIIQRDKTKGSVGWGPVHLGKHLCFRGGREKKGEKERKRGKRHPEQDCSLRAGVCARKAGQHCAFLTLKALQAGHLWLFTPHSLPGCCVPVPAGSVLRPFLFSPPSAVANSPEHLPPRHRVSTWAGKQEGEKSKPSLQQHGEGQDPACAWSPSQCHLGSAVGCFGGTPGCQLVLGTACLRLAQGEDGECRAVHTVGSSFLVWLGPPAAQSPLTPLFQITKLPRSH